MGQNDILIGETQRCQVSHRSTRGDKPHTSQGQAALSLVERSIFNTSATSEQGCDWRTGGVFTPRHHHYPIGVFMLHTFSRRNNFHRLYYYVQFQFTSSHIRPISTLTIQLKFYFFSNYFKALATININPIPTLSPASMIFILTSTVNRMMYCLFTQISVIIVYSSEY